MDINAFHIYYSNKKEERNFQDYFILTAILSALKWKELHKGVLTFYADNYTKDFFDKYNLTTFWDKCDSDILEKEIDPNHIDLNTFYTVGKFISFLHESPPCAMIDIDLIIWKNLESFLENKKAVFTHYEKSTPTSLWYPEKENLKTRSSYEFNPNWDFNQNAINTSFIYFNDEKLKEHFTTSALDYIYNNYIDESEKNIGNPELIFVEQRLLKMCINDLNLNKESKPLLDIIWDSKKGAFRNRKNCKNGWKFYDIDNNLITHTWIAKKTIEQNPLYRTYLCTKMIEKILEINHNYYDLLKNIPQLEKYLKLLDDYSSSDNLVNLGIASTDLYGYKKDRQKVKLL